MTREGPSPDSVAADSPILLWVTNSGAAEITANSIKSVRNAGFADRYRLVLVHCDDQARDLIADHSLGVELVPMSVPLSDVKIDLVLSREYHDYGTQTFRQVCFLRYPAIRYALLTYRRRTIYVDGDIVFLKNPALYLDNEPKLRHDCVFAQNDGKLEFVKDQIGRQYEPGYFPHKTRICTGFTVWSPLRAHLEIVKAVAQRMVTPERFESDQRTFNWLPRSARSRVQLLPLDKFVNGSFYFNLAKGDRGILDALDPHIIHANWMVGLETKTQALKEAGLWYL